jgi:predicted transcriptional regulator of viral defense system
MCYKISADVHKCRGLVTLNIQERKGIHKRLADLARESSVFQSRDVEAHGITREHLRRLHRKGFVERVGRGLYALTDAPVTEHHSLVEAAKRVPHGVVCLLSALRFHGLTTQSPFEVWLAIDRNAYRTKDDSMPLRIVRFSGRAMSEGIKEHEIEGVAVPIYCPAKMIADCFKYRNKIGLDVALEALRECWRERLCTMEDLWRYAKICRVANVMRPYLESLT